jgi:translation initiation factor 4A
MTSQENETNSNLISGEELNVVESYESFDSMNLTDNLLRGIYAYGFEKPSAIQKIAVMPILKGRDIIAQAQSGTGKTGAFTLAILSKIDFDFLEPQALIIVPVRELALQIAKVIENIGTYCDAKVYCCIGGQDVRSDESALRNGKHVIVGTPGRVFHMINKGSIALKNIKLMVIDEADAMLEKGFKDQLYEIFRLGFPEKMQIALFSATLTPQTIEIANKFMRNPVKIEVKKEEVNLAGIDQFKINMSKDEHKFATLLDLYKFISVKQAIIYANNKNKVVSLAAELTDHKLSMTFMHGEMTQEERNKIMGDFRSGKYRILITTDLLARGIDIQQVSLVINYDIPTNRENYVHRIGRTGRYGRKGVALNFITDRDAAQIKDIEEFYEIVIKELPADINGIFE